MDGGLLYGWLGAIALATFKLSMAIHACASPAAAPHLPVAADGETEHLPIPLDYRILAKALNVIAP